MTFTYFSLSLQKPFITNRMKYKRLSPLMLSALSAAFLALGFGSCKSKKALVQKRMEIEAKMARIDSEIADSYSILAQMQKEYENIGRGETVYGGPNNMAEAVRRMNERHERQRQECREAMQNVQDQIDSLKNEKTKAVEEMDKLGK